MPLERSVKLHISAYIWLVLPCRMPKCTCSGLWVSGSISFARLHEIYGNLFVFIMSAFPLFLACFPFVKSRRCPLAISISYVISVFSFPLVSFFFFFFFFRPTLRNGDAFTFRRVTDFQEKNTGEKWKERETGQASACNFHNFLVDEINGTKWVDGKFSQLWLMGILKDACYDSNYATSVLWRVWSLGNGRAAAAVSCYWDAPGTVLSEPSWRPRFDAEALRTINGTLRINSDMAPGSGLFNLNSFDSFPQN